MANKLIAVDTNVLIFLHDSSNLTKRTIATNLLADNPNIPSQVVSEYLNVTRRLLTLSKDQLLFQTAELFKTSNIIPTSPSTLHIASALIKKYQFQLFDAVVVASALEANCDILYSEDMHHGLVVNGLLTIINPFI